MSKKLVYVDTDIGLGTPGAEIDDGAALIFLLHNKLVDIVGAGSVFGNVPLHDAALNLDRLLTWLGGEHIALGLGAEKPLIADTAWFESWQSAYGKILSWNSRAATYLAANLIIHMIHAHPGQVSILSLGPMTNLALAIRLEPAIIPLTREVIVMGGSFNIKNPAPEFNVRFDPEAAQIVFSAGWDVHILGLDITRRVHFSRRDFSSLPDVELLRAQATGWIDRAVAAAYLVDDSIFQIEKTSIEVELADPNSRGITRFPAPTENRPIVNVITGLDTVKCRDLIWSHVQSAA